VGTALTAVVAFKCLQRLSMQYDVITMKLTSERKLHTSAFRVKYPLGCWRSKSNLSSSIRAVYILSCSFSINTASPGTYSLLVNSSTNSLKAGVSARLDGRPQRATKAARYRSNLLRSTSLHRGNLCFNFEIFALAKGIASRLAGALSTNEASDPWSAVIGSFWLRCL
jgi:hypothetical protein